MSDRVIGFIWATVVTGVVAIAFMVCSGLSKSDALENVVKRQCIAAHGDWSKIPYSQDTFGCSFK